MKVGVRQTNACTGARPNHPTPDCPRRPVPRERSGQTFWQPTPGIVGVLRKQQSGEGGHDSTAGTRDTTRPHRPHKSWSPELERGGEVRVQAQGKPHRGDLTDLTSCGQLQLLLLLLFRRRWAIET
jgi:hypothetical protein